jgi:hypothetical protein
MPRHPDPAIARLWRQRLQRFRQGQWSVAAFCEQEGVSTAAFYSWRRRLTQPAASARPDFVGVRLVAPAPALELLLPSGLALRIGSDCEPALLRDVLALLGLERC